MQALLTQPSRAREYLSPMFRRLCLLPRQCKVICSARNFMLIGGKGIWSSRTTLLSFIWGKLMGLSGQQWVQLISQSSYTFGGWQVLRPASADSDLGAECRFLLQLGIDYYLPHITIKSLIGLTAAPTVTTSISTGWNDLAFGGQATFDTAKDDSLTTWTAGVGEFETATHKVIFLKAYWTWCCKPSSLLRFYGQSFFPSKKTLAI